MRNRTERLFPTFTRYLHARRVQLSLCGLSLLLFLYVCIVNAWVVDDAYITFRTADNFLHGYGLRWNVDERAQVYTHPLWLFAIIGCSFFTSEVFYTSITLSLLCTLGAVLLASHMLTLRFRAHLWKIPLLIVALVSSKAFIDYTSSGLENALSYLIVAIFYATLTSFGSRLPLVSPRRLALLCLFASFAFVNRQDTLLLYLPALVYAIIAARSLGLYRLVAWAALGTLPALLWVGFSLVYYGFAFPNTAYAKVLSNAFPLAWKISRGLQYFHNSICWDSLSYLFLTLAAVTVCASRKSPAARALLGGVALYLLFILCSAASATHMSGRFFAVPFFIAIVICVAHVNSLRIALSLIGVSTLYISWSPLSPLKFGTETYGFREQNQSCIDTKWFAADEGAAIVNWEPGKQLPDHPWYHYGERLRCTPAKVHVGGAFGSEAIGYLGYAAGPQKFIVDTVGLGDPLLSRLQAAQPATYDEWKSGHFHRDIPSGYIQSVEQDRNVVQDPGLHAYYDKIRIITRGDIWSRDRLLTIWNMNTGRYEHLLRQSQTDGTSN